MKQFIRMVIRAIKFSNKKIHSVPAQNAAMQMSKTQKIANN